jgi:hypothetical protein
MGLFRRKTNPDPAPESVTITGEELAHAARELNNGNDGPADRLVDRAGNNKGLRQQIAMHVLGASVDVQDD